MKKIPLTGKYGKGKFALVSDCDFDFFSAFRWVLHKKGYVITGAKTTRIHRLLFPNIQPNQDVDHINHNKLDNRRENLRVCSRSENQMNRVKREDTSSKYKGVSFKKQQKKWVASIKVNGKLKHLGYYIKESDAAQKYNEFARKIFGEFALLNA